MKIIEIGSLIKNHRLFLSLTTIILFCLTTLLLFLTNQETYQEHLFYSISSKGNQYYISEDTTITDQFTETLIGIIKNPGFKHSLSDNFTNFNIAVKKFEKSNLLITIKSTDKANHEKVTANFKNIFENILFKYNLESDIKYNIAFASQYSESTNKLNVKNFILNFIFSAFFSIFLLIALKLFQGKIITLSQLNYFENIDLHYLTEKEYKTLHSKPSNHLSIILGKTLRSELIEKLIDRKITEIFVIL